MKHISRLYDLISVYYHNDKYIRNIQHQLSSSTKDSDLKSLEIYRTHQQGIIRDISRIFSTISLAIFLTVSCIIVPITFLLSPAPLAEVALSTNLANSYLARNHSLYNLTNISGVNAYGGNFESWTSAGEYLVNDCLLTECSWGQDECPDKSVYLSELHLPESTLVEIESDTGGLVSRRFSGDGIKAIITEVCETQDVAKLIESRHIEIENVQRLTTSSDYGESEVDDFRDQYIISAFGTTFKRQILSNESTKVWPNTLTALEFMFPDFSSSTRTSNHASNLRIETDQVLTSYYLLQNDGKMRVNMNGRMNNITVSHLDEQSVINISFTRWLLQSGSKSSYSLLVSGFISILAFIIRWGLLK